MGLSLQPGNLEQGQHHVWVKTPARVKERKNSHQLNSREGDGLQGLDMGAKHSFSDKVRPPLSSQLGCQQGWYSQRGSQSTGQEYSWAGDIRHIHFLNHPKNFFLFFFFFEQYFSNSEGAGIGIRTPRRGRAGTTAPALHSPAGPALREPALQLPAFPPRGLSVGTRLQPLRLQRFLQQRSWAGRRNPHASLV